MTRLVVVGVAASAALILCLLVLIRNRRLQERHAIPWLVGALCVVVLGVWQDALGWFSRLIGVAYPPSALFLVVFVLLGLVLLDTVIVLSRSVARTRALAQRIAVLEERLERLAAPDADGDAPQT